MELFTAINQRQSCRDFLNDDIEKEDIEKIIEAGIMAPSPLNSQPWDFIVITNNIVKEQLFNDVEKCKAKAVESSGWKWLEKYSVEFLRTPPVIIVVTGDKNKSGVDFFQEEGPVAYQHACAAAIQNMLLASHALGLGSVWFTLFDKASVTNLLNIDDNKVPLAFICLGKPAKEAVKAPRKPMAKKTVFID
ncbi:MAG: nitroreductase family protein [Desulfobacteraceae bacterium]|nr:nitroreductase family protein [Desulfobacteraceae bacterium]